MAEDFNIDDYKKSLPPSALQNMQIGGKTEAHGINSVLLGGMYGAVKAGAAPIVSGATTAVRHGTKLLRKEWGDRTLSRDVYQDWQQYGIEPKGLEGWRPLNAIRWGAGGGPQTGPTKAAETAQRLMINTLNRKRGK